MSDVSDIKPQDGEDQPATSRVDGAGPGSHRVLIQMLLRQTPEQRLLGLRRAARFFAEARRVQ